MFNVRKASLPLTGSGIAAALIFAGLATPANAVDTPSGLLQPVTTATPHTMSNAADVATGLAGANVIEMAFADTAVTVAVDPAADISLSSQRGTTFGTDVNQSTIDKTGIRQRLTQHGVASDVQDNLIVKLDAGVPWDSQNGTQPISTLTAVNDFVQTTTKNYPDGSLIVDTVQIPKKVDTDSRIQRRSIENCTHGAGVGTFPFFGCHVSTNQFLFTIDFYVDGRISNIGNAGITNYHSIGYWTGAATVNSTSFNLIRRNQNGANDAQVQAVLHVTFLAGSGSGVYQLTFHVRDRSMWDTSP